MLAWVTIDLCGYDRANDLSNRCNFKASYSVHRETAADI